MRIDNINIGDKIRLKSLNYNMCCGADLRLKLNTIYKVVGISLLGKQIGIKLDGRDHPWWVMCYNVEPVDNQLYLFS